MDNKVDFLIKALNSGFIDFNDIQKAHKFIRKEPDGKGGWNYVYKDSYGQEHSNIQVELKQLKAIKNDVDNMTNYVYNPKNVSYFTVDNLKEHIDNLKKAKKSENYPSYKETTKIQIDFLIKYIEGKLEDLKIRMKKDKEESDYMKQWGHSSSYIDNRKK